MMWNERYCDAFSSYGREPNDFLKVVAQNIPKGPVLCIAEGEGRNAVYLAKLGYEVTAMDASDVGLQNAQKLAQENQVTLTTIHADLEHFDFQSNYWSGIVSIWAHLPPTIRKKVHANLVKGLQQNGVFVLEAYAPRHLQTTGIGGPPVVELLMDKDIVQQELQGLDFELIQECERQITEGTYHQGTSITTQILGRKIIEPKHLID